jgi:hypothetical protein
MKYIDIDMTLARQALTRTIVWSERSLSTGRGRHQRDDDQKVKNRFEVDKRSFKEGPVPFDFHEEARAIEATAYANSKGIWVRNVEVPPKYMRIPERYFGIV